MRFLFEDYALDTDRRELHRGADVVALAPQVFDLLHYLIQNRERVVSKDDLIAGVWDGRIVSDSALTTRINAARSAIGDSGGAQRLIKTVPRKGIRFVAAVREERRPALAAAADALAGAATAGIAPGPPSPGPALPDKPSIAVLPFANLSGDPAQEYLSDGFTEDIINGLSYFSELSVIARNSSFAYKGRAVDVRAVGRELGVGYLVEGSVRRFGDRIRITAQLVDTRSGIRRWAERFDRTVGEVFAIQDEITHSIVRIAVAHLSHAERERVRQKPPISWTAYDLVLQGDEAHRANRVSWEIDDIHEARRLYAEALGVDPDNAVACAKLALCYVRSYHDPSDPELGNPSVLKRGYDLAEKAVGLDPNLPLARANLGWALLWMRQHDAAVSEYEKAFALNPNFSDPLFGGVLAYAGEASRALGFAQAHLRLDPFHPPHLNAIQGHALYMLRRYREAITPLKESIRRTPRFPLGHLWLAATLVRLGQGEEAKAVAAEVLRRSPRVSDWLQFLLPYRNPDDAEHMIDALREAGIS